jgi:hypothetical protein
MRDRVEVLRQISVDDIGIAQGSRMKHLYAQDRSAICSEVPPFAGFYRVSAPVTCPKVPQP